MTLDEFHDRSIELLQTALERTFLDLDRLMLVSMKEMIELKQDANYIDGWKATEDGYDLMDAGTAVLIVIITPYLIICANAGDCRAILCYKTDDRESIQTKVIGRPSERANGSNQLHVTPLSTDHKPHLPQEEQRILEAGGTICGGKVDGTLSLSRGLGDFNFKVHDSILLDIQDKNEVGACDACDSGQNNSQNYARRKTLASQQKVSALPDFIVRKRNHTRDLFLLGACDGIWDVVSNSECADVASTIFQEGERNLGLVTEEVIDICLKKGSRDNMSVFLLKFPLQDIGQGGGVQKRRKRRQAQDMERVLK